MDSKRDGDSNGSDKGSDNGSEFDLSTLPLALRMRVLDMLAPPQRNAALADTHHTRLPRVTCALFGLSDPRAFNLTHSSSLGDLKPLELSREQLALLDTRGYLVLDSVFGSEVARAARVEAETLRSQGALHSAGLSRAQSFYHDASVRSDEIVWLTALATDAPSSPNPNPNPKPNPKEEVEFSAVPVLSRVVRALDALRLSLNACCAFDSERTEVQLACYAGQGARYVRHLDAFVGGSPRRLTVLYYLNEHWQPQHGGALRLYNVHGHDDPNTSSDLDVHVDVDVSPLADRVVVFQSRVIEHEVLPAHAPRFSLTVWFH